MKIDQTTKISHLIRQNPEVIDAIASINKHFEKLRNPILRKILASRVSIADAARIGGVSIQEFYEKLRPLGFSFAGAEEENVVPEKELPEFYKNRSSAKIRILDVTGDIAVGRDPFQKIMQAVSQLPSGDILQLTNSFEPIPLINILNKKGYESYVLHEPGLVHTFLKRKPDARQQPAEEGTLAETDFEEMQELIRSYGKRIIHLDVRDMEMPLPMITVLEELEALPEDHLLHVSHIRIPVHLLPQLKEKGFAYYFHKAGENDVLILIHRA